ncbi:PAS domain-containing protein [Candidatus Reidiella endopervernicosa]|uniref:PAS domain S-box protein n=1 Tax=Candidatus Reidiella endopervernicosa TaxID=2738883 RepID=A0A6N0HSG4_9GAMM|nr:PAS domain S-box protein [Candidatus Reidiella endopervernicosa]QKQ25349.1 PAS domain S-box protein [Candidatus Reidiella endopervernicosa]
MNSNGLSTQILIALTNHLQDAVFAVEEGCFIFVNQRVTDLFGYSELDIIGQPILDFVFEEDQPLVAARYKARLMGEQVESEYSFRIVTKSGEVREVNMRVGLTQDDEHSTTLIGSLQDITDAVQTRAALEHSQADIESILNNMPDVFYRTDMNGVITLMSPSCHEVIGYTPEEMIGRPMVDFYCDASDRERIVQALTEGEGKAQLVEACLRHKDQSSVWISTNAYIRYDDAGEAICIEGSHATTLSARHSRNDWEAGEI